MSLRLLFLSFICSLAAFQSSAQSIINGYASLSAISGTTLTLGAADESNDLFEVGESLLIMQMQDDVIGANTNNNPSFGDVGDIASAGLYEEAVIQSVSRTSSTVWTEDFEDNVNDWFTGCSGGTCNPPTIQNTGGPTGRGMVAYFTDANNGNYSFWATNPIDISAYAYVDISLLAGQLNLENDDYMLIGYYLDGGGFTTVENNSYLNGNFGYTTASSSKVSGTTLQLAVFFVIDQNNEYAGIDNVVVTGYSNPTSITVTQSFVNSYSTGPNARVQAVTFPKSDDYSTTSDLTALDWNGNYGGVLAMEVFDSLTLNNDINLDGKGFRGGALNNVAESTPRVCNPEVYRTDNGEYAAKGESIYRNTNALYARARGKSANGGGGGSRHNSGGGGGGNFTAGGIGGPGYNESAPTDGCDDDPSGDAGTGAAGYGGVDLSDYISADRIFLGGGGGGGQQDGTSGASEAGGDGGGIIIIKANTIYVPCGAGVTISVNGEGFPYPSTDAGNEGAPGAGAGGSILFQVINWALDCPLNTEAKGGEGQSSVNTNPHGGGGGGGRGVTIFSGAAPASNYTADNSQGAGGLNGTGASAGSASAGSSAPTNSSFDPNGDGVIESQQGPLPVQLIGWSGTIEGQYHLLQWSTASELNNQFFTVERSVDGENWEVIAYVEGHGTTNNQNDYEYKDYYRSASMTYYRLSQTDFDGQNETFDVIALAPQARQVELLLFPNPTQGEFRVQFGRSGAEQLQWTFYNALGQLLNIRASDANGELVFNIEELPKGNYFLHVTNGNQDKTFRVVKR
ncbi:T9SS type A sorting domain-containing protein [Marinoscillum furvescens]|uniref:Putative secreted protein (Por secretion system target) n=1 Tax=Marinoscillum furvescens DSM 4134 TaxID=1122208 RepID=A0A3D9L5L6_MARFU|nr:T9SS type A sorting domain-containing protein [Marinoscillum furvescens]REE00566.1 putative secreted protein (Por secretion system target) [Marinoscillum furvescens DSM 4134]